MALVSGGLVFMFIVIVAIIAAAAFFIWGIKHALMLALNSVIGFFALYAVKAWLLPELVLNVWSVLLVALLGLVGLILVTVLHLTGAAF